MGFDPAAASGAVPFTHVENHLALACQAGLGTNDLVKIEIVGSTIEEARFPFKPVD